MTTITPPEGGDRVPLGEPAQFCPIELYWAAHAKWGMSIYQFADNLGWEANTIQRWQYGLQPPSKRARIVAAYLKKEWGL